MTVKLPNGSLGTTNFAWTIHFDDDFVLTNVLHMPHFIFNLIYVPKLTLSLECQLIFNTTTCFIQTSYSKKMIGVVELRRGLYILNHSMYKKTVRHPFSKHWARKLCLYGSINKIMFHFNVYIHYYLQMCFKTTWYFERGKNNSRSLELILTFLIHLK